MAYFKLSLLFLNDHEDGMSDSNVVEYLPSVISEFYSQDTTTNMQNDDILNVKRSFCYTYDEQFQKHQNGRRDLSFSMSRMVLQDNEGIENPYVKHLHIGTQLLLEDKYNNQYLFTVTKIDYAFKLNNVNYQVTCQDTFSYQLTRQNDGYTIENDSSTTDFIGAKNIDWWTNKIVDECHVAYQYLPLNTGLYQQFDLTYNLSSTKTYNNNCEKIIKPVYSEIDDKDLFETIPFSGSGNAASILISLGEQLGMVLNTFEHFQYEDHTQTNKLIRYFWFEPAKKNETSGLLYSPFDSIQQFSLSHAGTSLISVLNVSGPNFENELVALLPDISPFFLNLFQSEQWARSHYYPNMYHDMMNEIIYHYNTYEGGDFSIPIVKDNEVNYDITPIHRPEHPDGNAIIIQQGVISIPLKNIQKDLFFIPGLYENLDFRTDDNTSSIILSIVDNNDQVHTITVTPHDCDGRLQRILSRRTGQWKDINFSTEGNKDYAAFLNIDIQDILVNLAINIKSMSGASMDLYLRFSRTPTSEDFTFAEVADSIPWLENKLIDFSYFKSHNLLNNYQYSQLTQAINDDLRIINGQLIGYTQEYYNALHKQTQTLAELDSLITSLESAFNFYVVDSYNKNGSVTNLDSFTETYNEVVSNLITVQQQPLINYGELLTSFLNKYYHAQQRFYKNVSNFINYFEAPLSVLGTNARIVQNTITIDSSEPSRPVFPEGSSIYTDTHTRYTFANGNQTTPVDTNFTDYDADTESSTYGKAFVPIVDPVSLNEFPIVHAGNYLEYDRATKYAMNDFYPIYSETKTYDPKEDYYYPECICEIEYIKEIYEDLLTYRNQWPFYYSSDVPYIEQTVTVGSESHSLRYQLYDMALIEVQKNNKNNDENKYAISCTFRPLIQERIDSFNDFASFIHLNESDTLPVVNSQLTFTKLSPLDITKVYIKRRTVDDGTTDFGTTRYYNNIFTPIKDFYNPTGTFPYTKSTGADSNDTWSDSSFKTNGGFVTYCANIPLNVVYVPTLNYQDGTLRDIYNKAGQSLYQFLKHPDTIKNPFTDEKIYSPIYIANATNYTSYYHIVTYGNYYNYSSSANYIMWLQQGLLAPLEHTGPCTFSIRPFGSLPIVAEGFPILTNAITFVSDQKYREQMANYNAICDYIDTQVTTTSPLRFDGKPSQSNCSINITNSSNTTYTITPAYFNQLTNSSNAKAIINYGTNTYYLTYDKNEDNYYANQRYYVLTMHNLLDSLDQSSIITHDNIQYDCNNIYFKDKFLGLLKLDHLVSRSNNYGLVVGKQTSIQNSRELSVNCLIKDWKDIDPVEDDSIQNILSSGGGTFGTDRFKISAITHYPIVQHMSPIDISEGENGSLMSVEDIFNRADRGQFTRINNYIFKITSTTQNSITTESYCSVVQIQDYNIEDIKSSDYFNTFDGATSSIYDKDDNPIDFTKKTGYVQYLFIPAKYDQIQNVQSNLPFDMNGHYYKNGIRCYTIEQLKALGTAAVLNNTTYQEITLNNRKTEFTLPVLKTIITNTGERRLYIKEGVTDISPYTVGKKVDVALSGDILAHGTVQNILFVGENLLDDVRYNVYILLDKPYDNDDTEGVIINVSQTQQQITNTFVRDATSGEINYIIKVLDLDNELNIYNNGSFGYEYHKKPEYAVLFELAAAIETQLQTYWSQAYNASLYCDYFLPFAGQEDANAQVNHFASHIYRIDEQKHAHINYNFLPHITKKTLNTSYNIIYIPDLTEHNFNQHNYVTLESIADEIGIHECFDNINMSFNNGYAEPLQMSSTSGQTTTYYFNESGGVLWSELVEYLKIKSVNYDKFTGIYPLTLMYLYNRFYNRTNLLYTEYKRRHDHLWKQLYSNFPSVILEDNYTNEDATTSKDLLTVARNVFKDRSYPERGYNITMIDSKNLEGYLGQELRIGDPIALRSTELYQGGDDVQNSLSQFLFITDIKYNLRKDTDINLTVNSIKYQDKMLQRLVKLIK